MDIENLLPSAGAGVHTPTKALGDTGDAMSTKKLSAHGEDIRRDRTPDKRDAFDSVSDTASSSPLVAIREHPVIDVRYPLEEDVAGKLASCWIDELRFQVKCLNERQTTMESKLEQAITLMAQAQEMIVSQEQII